MCKIEFDLGNAAYRMEDRNGQYIGVDNDAVANTVKLIAEKIGNGYTSGPIMDYNGNKVGKWSIEEPKNEQW